MKTILLLFLATTAQAGTIIDLVSDQSTYTANQSAVLLGNVIHPPTNDGLELYFEAKVNGVPVKAIKLTDTNVLSLSEPLAVAGSQEWRVRTFWQPKIMSRELNKAILLYQAEIERITALLATETNPTVIASLQAELAKNQSRKAAAEDALVSNRREIEVTSLSFGVEPTLNSFALSAVLSLALDKPSYAAGEKAELSTSINTGFTGKEDVLLVDLDGNALTNTFASGSYKTVSPPLVSGNHVFTAKYYVRAKKQADLLRNAVSGAYTNLSSLTTALSKATDPGEKLYLQAQIKDLSFAINGVNSKLDAVRDLVVTDSVSFEVQ